VSRVHRVIYAISIGERVNHEDEHSPLTNTKLKNDKAVPAGLEWPRGFQEVMVPRFHDNGTGWW